MSSVLWVHTSPQQTFTHNTIDTQSIKAWNRFLSREYTNIIIIIDTVV